MKNKIKTVNIEFFEKDERIIDLLLSELEGKDPYDVDITITIHTDNSSDRYYLMSESEKKIVDEIRERKKSVIDKISDTIDNTAEKAINFIFGVGK